jgi:hypothetical protein
MTASSGSSNPGSKTIGMTGEPPCCTSVKVTVPNEVLATWHGPLPSLARTTTGASG